MIEPGLLALLNQTVTVAAVTGRDAYGRPTGTGTPVTYRARVESKAALIVDDTGREVPVEGVAYLEPAAAGITANTTVTLDDGRTVILRVIKPEPDADGSIHHVAAYFGRS